MDGIGPSLEDLRATVARMEARLRAAPDAGTQALLAHYLRLKPRFAADLADARDFLLACSAALMLVQQAGRESGPG